MIRRVGAVIQRGGSGRQRRKPVRIGGIGRDSLDRRVLWSDATAADDPNLLAPLCQQRRRGGPDWARANDDMH